MKTKRGLKGRKRTMKQRGGSVRQFIWRIILYIGLLFGLTESEINDLFGYALSNSEIIESAKDNDTVAVATEIISRISEKNESNDENDDIYNTTILFPLSCIIDIIKTNKKDISPKKFLHVIGNNVNITKYFKEDDLERFVYSEYKKEPFSRRYKGEEIEKIKNIMKLYNRGNITVEERDTFVGFVFLCFDLSYDEIIDITKKYIFPDKKLTKITKEDENTIIELKKGVEEFMENNLKIFEEFKLNQPINQSSL